mmetsp:Transcript_5522/g.14694  ORF Transcript_5522/g.14694 Transcript_5522/m.14694 type:complete len:86 (-) Transcript_5522:467-724(-)
MAGTRWTARGRAGPSEKAAPRQRRRAMPGARGATLIWRDIRRHFSWANMLTLGHFIFPPAKFEHFDIDLRTIAAAQSGHERAPST